MKKGLWKCGAVLAALFALQVAAPEARAQFRAGIQGVVKDPSGLPVPGAKVTLTSQETKVRRTATTNAEGVYAIPSLAPGRYELSVEKEGFSKKVLSDVRITAEQMHSVDVTLAVGQVSESITVSETVVPLIDTQTAVISGTITTKEVENLPSFGRDPYQLLRLAPGVFGNGALTAGGGSQMLPGTNMGGSGATDSIFKVENGAQIIANGTRQNSNSFQIDGVGVNSASWGGAAVITPNEESVKEVRVVANNYSAELGRNSGAQVMVVSKNGTNDPHGSFFAKFHRPELNAYQRWNGPGSPSPVAKDTNDFNQFGGSLGGPILKNRLFSFFSYETIRNDSVNIGTGWYETPQFRQSAAPNNSVARQLLSFPGVEPVTVASINMTCAQVGLPPSQCRDVAGGLDLGSPLKSGLRTPDPTYGQAGTPYGIGGGFDGVADVMFLQTRGPNKVTNQQFNGRLDYNLSEKDSLTFSVYWVPVDNKFFNGPARSHNLFNHNSTARSFTGIYTRTISPTMINEARFGLSGWDWNEFESNPQMPWGLPTANLWGMGGIGVANFGAPGFSIFDQKTLNYRDTLTKIQGSHTLKFGADVSNSLFLDTAPWSARPSYDFRSLWEFANDAPYREGGNFDPVTGQPTTVEKNLRFHVVGVFVQDDWKVRPNLTVNLGLRWEYFSPLTEKDGKISTPVLGSGADALRALRMRRGGDLFRTSKNNWGPQLGFAWTPSSLLGRDLGSKLVFRGGFGIGYNLQQLAITSNGRFNPPFVVDLSLFGSDIVYSVNSDLKSYTGWPANPAAIQRFDPNTGLPLSGAPVNLTGYPEFMPSTVTYRYSFDAQYEFARNWMASIGYQGSQSRHYTIQNNLNYFFINERNPRVQNLNWYSNDVSARYNAMLVQVQRRFARDVEFDFQYRLSRNEDVGSQDYFMPMYPWNRARDWGPSDYDVTHNFKFWGVWTPSFFKAKGPWLQRLADGWSVSWILNAHSGFPWTPNYCNTSGSVGYPDSGIWCIFPASYSGGGQSRFDSDAFRAPGANFPKGALAYLTVPTWPRVGIPPMPDASVHRNMFRGPRYFGLDATLSKSFRFPKMPVFGENARVVFQSYFYNVFNKLNLKDVNTTISNDGVNSNPLFGTAQGALAGRIVEFQVKFSF
jgi:hypothetical protein